MDGIETVGLCLMALVGAVLAVVFGRSAWRGLFPGRWRKVPAHVVRAHVEGTQRHGTTRYASIVEYAYRVGADELRGTSTVYGGVTSRGSAEEALAPYPPGREITVEIYRPDPRESRMRRSESAMAALGTLFGLGAVAFALWKL